MWRLDEVSEWTEHFRGEPFGAHPLVGGNSHSLREVEVVNSELARACLEFTRLETTVDFGGVCPLWRRERKEFSTAQQS